MAADPKGRATAVCLSDCVQLINQSTGQVLAEYELKQEPSAVQFTQDGEYLVVVLRQPAGLLIFSVDSTSRIIKLKVRIENIKVVEG